LCRVFLIRFWRFVAHDPHRWGCGSESQSIIILPCEDCTLCPSAGWGSSWALSIQPPWGTWSWRFPRCNNGATPWPLKGRQSAIARRNRESISGRAEM
jgi:hypothetical protein